MTTVDHIYIGHFSGTCILKTDPKSCLGFDMRFNSITSNCFYNRILLPDEDWSLQVYPKQMIVK